jgi:hypothetical protein
VPSGDDAGCFTTDATHSLCEQKAGRHVVRLFKALVKCHQKLAASAVQGTAFNEDLCEFYAIDKFASAAKTDDCPCVYAAQIADDLERFVDQDLNQSLYCMDACPAGAVSVGGVCWVLGAPGADCDTACATIGQTCDAATVSYLGSDGTDANCGFVSHALGTPATAIPVPGCPTGIGCAFGGGVLARCTTPSTTCSAVDAGMQRICACH